MLKIDHGYVSVTATFDTPVTKDFGTTGSRISSHKGSLHIRVLWALAVHFLES